MAVEGDPILSYGIILFSIDERNVPLYLIFQRRDNYEYIDILRGNWNNHERFKELVSALSFEERERLTSYTFRELWDDLWIVHGSRIHTEGYERAKKKYESIKPQLHEILSNTPHNGTEPPWGFPKGKKNFEGNETEINCALREFREETGLSTDNVKLWDVKPFTENYKGNNNKMYGTYYYLAESPEILKVTKINTPGCIRDIALSEESEDALWLSLDEACSKLNTRRKNILKAVDLLVLNKYDKLSPFA